jgi:superfamily I DNA/RNA helicase
VELSEREQESDGSVLIGIMHLAKELEFKAAAVMACDDSVLPLQSRLESVADESELDNVYETERQLFYVAYTRARDRLLVSGVKPGWEFSLDLHNRDKPSPYRDWQRAILTRAISPEKIS